MEDSDAELRPGEEHLAALTAADRKSWAEMREKYFMTGVNRTSMEILEKVCGGRREKWSMTKRKCNYHSFSVGSIYDYVRRSGAIFVC